ncbi:alpha/beta fold hydrolase [Kitasatospora sp. NPDC087314]|uniref:alpha/beta fold hydrolase n=1 Tax=Kitasatospora sp. NPDC087314 TaxID=3364068 RepID=UPI0037F39424
MILSHDVSGTGPTLLLLHSSVCDRRMWDPQWQGLVDAGYRVVRCDFRGFGDTPLADGPYSDAQDVLALLDHLGIESAALIGSSHGGKIATDVAALRPAAVTALALLCPGASGRTPGPALRAFAAKERELLVDGDLAAAVELNVETWLGPEADDEARAHVRRMQRHAFEVQADARFGPSDDGADLGRITAPCLVVSGGHDVEDFRQIGAFLPTVIPNARHVELPWAGHFPGLERPEEAFVLLTGFLDEAAAPQPR